MTLSADLEVIQRILTRYVLLVCFIFGFVGNLFNVIVFCQKHLRNNSCSVYFISTSICNLLVILFGLMPIILTSYTGYDHASYSTIYCKFRSYIVHVLLMMSRCSVTLACLDRYALCSPNIHIRALNQYSVAIRLLAATVIMWLLVPIHVLIAVNVQLPTRRCGGVGVYSTIYSMYAALVTAIPLILMMGFSWLACQNLRQVRCRVHPTNPFEPSLIRRIKKRDGQFVIILVSEVILYFVSTVLFPVYSIYVAATANMVKSATQTAVEGFIRYITLSFLLYVNSCSIFYMHLLASKAFRQECYIILLIVLRKKPLISGLFFSTDISNRH